jgi:hypothetical protein
MSDPAVLFYTSDFLTGTAFFTDAERGQYIRLLCEQHQIGHIPEKHMITICFSLASPVVKKFIKDSAGNYYNERMEKEIIKRKKFTESRSYNGKLGGRPKEIKKPSGKALALATEKLIDNENINEINLLKEYCKNYFDEKYINEDSIDCFDKLLRIDNYSIEQIKTAILNARSDDFWAKNFLSPVKLRDKDKNKVKYIDKFLAIKSTQKQIKNNPKDVNSAWNQ